MKNAESDRGARFAELTQSVQELHEAANILHEYTENPAYFWDKEYSSVVQGLRENFDYSANPENQIIIPVYQNWNDIGPLLKGLSQQKMDGIGTSRLTFVMHNNSGENGTQRDLTWDIVNSLCAHGVPIETRELNDSLLTGPFMSYQFALGTSEATETLAILDADSVPTRSWFYNLRQPFLQENSPLVTTGARLPMHASFLTKAMRSAEFTAKNSKYLLSGNTRIGHLTGGQAAYNADAVRSEIEDIYGLLDGDMVLSGIFHEKYGLDSIQYVTAPVINIPTGVRGVKTPAEFLSKTKGAVSCFLPDSIRMKIKTRVPEEKRTKMQVDRIHHYFPWSRDIIDTFYKNTSNGKQFTVEQLTDVFAQTADKVGFRHNTHVKEFIKEGVQAFRPNQQLNSISLFHALQYIGYRCLRPTLKEYIRRSQEEKLPVY